MYIYIYVYMCVCVCVSHKQIHVIIINKIILEVIFKDHGT